jgi:hypothetical protein
MKISGILRDPGSFYSLQEIIKFGRTAREIMIIFLCSGENILDYMTLQGFAPTEGRPGSDSAALPVFKNADSSRAGNTGASHAPPPPLGAGLAQGGGAIIFNETGILQSIF